MIVSNVKMATVEPAQARDHLTLALKLAEEMRAQGQLAPRDAWMVDDLASRIAAASK